MSQTFGEKMLGFYENLDFNATLPSRVEVMNPYKNPEVMEYMRGFSQKFFNDNNTRVLVLGINPGRFSSGMTGVSFTDPVALSDFCGIPCTLPRVRERSSEFIYSFIEHYGGASKFYKDFFLTAVSPLGFTHDGINHNYYDSPELLNITKSFILDTLQKQIDLGTSKEAAILIGTGKNLKFFTEINNEYQFFKKLHAVEHPRFIMQYKRRELSEYLRKYQEIFSETVAK